MNVQSDASEPGLRRGQVFRVLLLDGWSESHYWTSAQSPIGWMDKVQHSAAEQILLVVRWTGIQSPATGRVVRVPLLDGCSESDWMDSSSPAIRQALTVLFTELTYWSQPPFRKFQQQNMGSLLLTVRSRSAFECRRDHPNILFQFARTITIKRNKSA